MLYRRILSILVVLVLFTGLNQPGTPPGGVQAQSAVECRFGITVASWTSAYPNLPNISVSAYDLPLIGIGYYLDWGREPNPSVPDFIPYVYVLPVRENFYQYLMLNFDTLIQAHPGSIWILGNEPDNGFDEQDYVTPEVYADRSYEYATRIRLLDPSAKIGFGSIIMGTPMRIRYLKRSWNQLVVRAGSQSAASALIDFWAPHGFNLNEKFIQCGTPAYPGGPPDYEHCWGSGIPLGMETDSADAELVGFNEMDSLPKFKARIENFRTFMKDIGEKEKPLWLTEFGVLAPSVTPDPLGQRFFTISENRTIAFMEDTFTYLETEDSLSRGLSTDANRLVQKFFWYSLNDALYHFGGTLINPETLQRTTLGNAYHSYELPDGRLPAEPFINPDFEPISIKVRPIYPGGGKFQVTDYFVDVRVRNHVIHNHLNQVEIKIYNENNSLLGTAYGSTARCGGDVVKSFRLNGIQPGTRNLKVVVQSQQGLDINPGNNTKTFPVQFIYYTYFVSLIEKP